MVRRDFMHHPSWSTPQAEEQQFFRELNLVKIDDMHCATRHDRLRTLQTIIKRGEEWTEIEKVQLAELEDKGFQSMAEIYREWTSRIWILWRGRPGEACCEIKSIDMKFWTKQKRSIWRILECCFTRKGENRRYRWRASVDSMRNKTAQRLHLVFQALTNPPVLHLFPVSPKSEKRYKNLIEKTNFNIPSLIFLYKSKGLSLVCSFLQ